MFGWRSGKVKHTLRGRIGTGYISRSTNRLTANILFFCRHYYKDLNFAGLIADLLYLRLVHYSAAFHRQVGMGKQIQFRCRARKVYRAVATTSQH